jgi:aryl-alcohol dehydrogenase-like predicted oxidoreductase
MSLRQQLLGRSGIRVSELCLGTMTFGTGWGWGADESVCREIYTAYREAGGNFVDTANLYTEGVSEQIVGQLIRDERDSIVLATKFTLPTNPYDVNSGGSHRKSLRRSIETSLRRLGTDYLDLLWVHAWDQLTPIEETLRALDDLVGAGKILAIGVSNTPAWVVSRSDAIAELRGWSAFCAVQVEYSLSARTADRELLPMARSLGLALIAWSPLAGGLLSGKFSRDDAAQPDMTGRAHRGRLSPLQQRAMEVVAQVAGELDTTPARVALSWVLRHGLIPVIGARTLAQLHDNLGAAQVRLDDGQLAAIDAATDVEMGYPFEFLTERCPTLSAAALDDHRPAPPTPGQPSV